MSVFGTNETLVKRISDCVNKLKSTPVSVEEMDELVNDVRELYERVLIVRHKAFEKHIGREIENNVKVEDESIELPKTEVEHIEVKENVVTHIEQKTESESFSFSLFDTIEDSVEEERIETKEEPVIESEKVIEEAPDKIETVQPEIAIAHHIATSTPDSPSSLFDKLSEQIRSNSLSDTLQYSRIETLTTAFSLNDRIRFTNQLFGGETETFRSAIELLDKQENKEIATQTIEQFATKYEWDLESNDVLHFYTYIERRYV
jgi:hypothetical protein